MKKQSIATGALYLSLAAICTKALGAVYKIPLTNIISAQGMGLYQMVFPLYALLLGISGQGMPNAIAAITCKKYANGDHIGARQTTKIAFISLAVIGLVAATLVFFLAQNIAKIQGNLDATLGYKAVAPAIFFVSIICVIKGVFLSAGRHTPNALSQILEQTAKLLFGLFFALKLLRYGTKYAVFGALLAITVSEIIALIYLIINYLLFIKKNPYQNIGQKIPKKKAIKQLYLYSLPIVLSGLIMPLCGIFDSIFVINILKISHPITQATAQFGLLSGHVSALVALPSVFSFALATAILPSISQSDFASSSRKATLATKYTWLTALPCVVGLMVLAPQIVDILYPSLSLQMRSLCTTLLRLSAINAIYIGLSQVFAYCLQAVQKPYKPLFALLCGCIVKLIFTPLFTFYFGIQGAAIAGTMCFACVALVHTFYIKPTNLIQISLPKFVVFPLLSALALGVSTHIFWRIFILFLHPIFALFVCILCGAIIYLLCIFGAQCVQKQELISLPFAKLLRKSRK